MESKLRSLAYRKETNHNVFNVIPINHVVKNYPSLDSLVEYLETTNQTQEML